ncbi:MAG: hypothetical protein ABFC96_12100 [Thermoguttaceae bacterium]
MNVDEAQDRMREIQRIMERATLFTLLPGAPAVIGGLLVLAGCAVSYAMLRSVDFAAMLRLSFAAQAWFCVMWFAIGVMGVLIEVICTTRAAAKHQLSPSSRPLQVAAFSLTPSVIVAMVLTLKFLISNPPGSLPKADEIQYIVPIWMMLYGTGVYTAGLFSIRPPRVLGLTFLGLGAVALLFFLPYGVISAAMSFGLLHILFGLYVILKQRQTVAA